MIYDTFLFFNELELLELRLRELAGVVDRFVVVESPRTHSNQPKPLVFAANRDRFRDFADRIIHVVVEDDPASLGKWTSSGPRRFAIEDHDRRSIGRGLTACRPDDVILTGDVDEIPRAEALKAAVAALRFRTDPLTRAWSWLLRQPPVVRHARNIFKKHHPRVTVFEQRMYYYFLNCACLNRPWWPGTRMVFYRDFTSAYDLRRWGGRRLPDAGWHFSFMGGVARIREKIAAYAHAEFNRPEFTQPETVEAALAAGRWVLGNDQELGFVPLDASFPAFVRDHPDRFPGWIR